MYDVIITKQQFPNINWKLIDESFEIHNDTFDSKLKFLAVLDEPPFKFSTRVLYYCEKHNLVTRLLVTTINSLVDERYSSCKKCNKRIRTRKAKFIEHYQQEINFILKTNNYVIKPIGEYHSSESFVVLYCAKHDKPLRRAQLKLIMYNIRKGKYNLNNYCQICKKESQLN